MLKTLALAGLGLAIWGLSLGCDQLAANDMAVDLAKVIPAAKPIQARDRLQDGTGAYCTDGGTQTGGGARNGNGGNGAGGGDRLRLRDGSCQ